MLFFTQCFGIFTDLIHLRFQHTSKHRGAFSAAGKHVCVVTPANPLRDASARSGRYSSSSSAGHTENRASHPCDAGVASPCPCSCPLLSCGWQGDLEVVALHLKDTHRASTLQGQRIMFLASDVHLPDAEDWVTVQSCLGQQFLLVLKKQERRQGHQQYFAAVMLLGPSRVAEMFTYRLELSSERRRLSWESAVRSFSEGLSTVIAESDCLVLNASLAHLFSDKGKLGIHISISADKHNTSFTL